MIYGGCCGSGSNIHSAEPSAPTATTMWARCVARPPRQCACLMLTGLLLACNISPLTHVKPIQMPAFDSGQRVHSAHVPVTLTMVNSSATRHRGTGRSGPDWRSSVQPQEVEAQKVVTPLVVISSPSRSRSTGSRTPQDKRGTRTMPGLPGWCEERTATRVAGQRTYKLDGCSPERSHAEWRDGMTRRSLHHHTGAFLIRSAPLTSNALLPCPHLPSTPLPCLLTCSAPLTSTDTLPCAHLRAPQPPLLPHLQHPMKQNLIHTFPLRRHPAPVTCSAPLTSTDTLP